MERRTYTARFSSTAFLGNAEQKGQWRTAPFKALLRQWWRISAAEAARFDYSALREVEGRLFGNAWLAGPDGKLDSRKSQVRLRLDNWGMGKETTQTWAQKKFAQVETTAGGNRLPADIYLGYGPVLQKDKGLKNDAITTADRVPRETATLKIAFPADRATMIDDALQLAQWFGTLGSRARNGWGSLVLNARDGTPRLSPRPGADDPLLHSVSRPFDECLALEWPHAIGRDAGGPLIWYTQPRDKWTDVISDLARIKVEVRYIGKGKRGPDNIAGIHLIAYPAGGIWNLPALGNDARLAGQLRFKVLPIDGKYQGSIAHLPCGFPAALGRKLTHRQQEWIAAKQADVWEAVHRSLDANRQLNRFS